MNKRLNDFATSFNPKTMIPDIRQWVTLDQPHKNLTMPSVRPQSGGYKDPQTRGFKAILWMDLPKALGRVCHPELKIQHQDLTSLMLLWLNAMKSSMQC